SDLALGHHADEWDGREGPQLVSRFDPSAEILTPDIRDKNVGIEQVSENGRRSHSDQPISFSAASSSSVLSSPGQRPKTRSIPLDPGGGGISGFSSSSERGRGRGARSHTES